MMTSTILLIFLSFCIGTGVWLFFLYAVKKGEFDDVEGPKYRMLDDDDEEPSDDDRNNEKHHPD
ncbi:MAG: cbb3-type cytochrome oxidase assembly protein CcoS [Pelovirga sp.]